MARWLLLTAALWPALLCWAAPVRTPHLEAELVSEVRAVEPGRPFTVALRLRHEPHWHTYWKNPGDSGMATAIHWGVPEGFRAGAPQWPTPARLPIGPLTNFGYEGEVFLLTDIEPPERLATVGRITIAADADWLVCKEICIPGSARLTLSLAVAGRGAEPDPRWAPAVGRARADLPRALSGWSAEVSERDGSITVALLPSSGRSARIDRLTFFPDEDGIIQNAAEQKLVRQGNRYRLNVAASQGLGSRSSVTGLLVAEPGWGVDLPVAEQAALAVVAPTTSDPAVALSLVVAVALAFVGGLILNLMPCVFPIVSIKVLGFVEQAHGDRRRLRTHGLAFASGVLVCFWALAAALLALRAAGAKLGWGYQLQSPLVITALAVLFFLLALNLSGVFEVGAGLQRAAGARSTADGYRGSFLAGVLATVVATPCTAPFMGAALGYALVQPAGTALLVFTALALGMALPYVLLSLAPALAQWLPRPGRWMQTLKQLLAFPLYLTVVWLTWVLGEQAGLSAATHLLVGLVLIAAAVWAWGRFGVPTAARQTRLACGAAALVLAVAGAGIAWPGDPPGPAQAPAQSTWQPFSAEALVRAQGDGRWTFVDFTAAWCVTCQVNKRLVLNTDVVVRRFAEKQVVLMRADWTSRDARIGEALQRLGRSGVPVYALYPPTGGPPRILPEILTQDVLLSALDAAEPI